MTGGKLFQLQLEWENLDRGRERRRESVPSRFPH